MRTMLNLSLKYTFQLELNHKKLLISQSFPYADIQDGRLKSNMELQSSPKSWYIYTSKSTDF